MATGKPTKSRGGSWEEVALTYPGKVEADRVKHARPATLLEVQGGPALTQASLIYGENLAVLASLNADPRVKGNVDLIYIDPPYATETSFSTRCNTHAYDDALTGPAYIEFIRQRLVLMYELMAKGGSLYIHIDSTSVFHIKLVLDEIFGSNGFRNCITRRKCNPKNYTREQFGNVSDFILFYTKGRAKSWNRPVEARSAASIKEYCYVDAESGRRYMKVPVHAPGTRNGATGQPWKGMLPPPGKHWQYTPERLDQMDAEGEIYWSSTGNPRRKVYLDERSGTPVQDIWLEFKDAHNQNIKITGYPTEKPESLLELIIAASSNEGDLVLDAFAGSGTTLDTAHRLKRRWIGIDSSPTALKVMIKRFATGLEPMGDFVNGRRDVSEVQLAFSENISGQSSQRAEARNFCIWATQEKLVEAITIVDGQVMSVGEDELAA